MTLSINYPMGKNIRLLSILERLSKGAKLSVKEQALYFDVSAKSIQNDFQILNEYFGEKLVKKGDSYTLLNVDSFSKIFNSNPQSIKRFLHLVSMVDATFYETFMEEHKELFEALNFSNTTVYQIENSPYEKLKAENKKILGELEEAISSHHYINLTYTHLAIESISYAHVIPLKILYLKENWYLAVLTTNNEDHTSMFKKLRINFITKVQKTKLEPRNFHKDNSDKIEAQRFLKNIQSPYSSMESATYEVKLRVSVEVARFFKSKHYLKSQRILKEFDDGDILVSYQITHEMEVIPLVQQWIPHLEVLEPMHIREKIFKNMKTFMKGV